jgi:hypothetical protein
MASDKKARSSFLESTGVKVFISILIIAHLVVLFLQNLLPMTALFLEQVLSYANIGLLLFFLLEFLVKSLVLRGRYLVRDSGWIDLLATLPLGVIVLEMTILQTSENSLILIKILAMVQMLRVIRIIRLLQIFQSMSSLSMKKLPLSFPVIVCLIIILGSYLLGFSIERDMKEERSFTMQRTALLLNAENSALVLEMNPTILFAGLGNEITRNYALDTIQTFINEGKTEEIKVQDTYIMYLVDDINSISNKVELMIAGVVILFIVSLMVVYFMMNIYMKDELKDFIKEMMDLA